MSEVTISAVQFKMRKIKQFKNFKQQVTRPLIRLKSDFIVFPELFTLELLSTLPNLSKLSLEDLKKVSQFTGEYMDLFSTLASERGKYIIAGSHIKEEKGRFYNSGFLFQPDGGVFEHKKTHVFPMERTWNTSEGNDFEVLKTDKATVGFSICYESQFPEVSRMLTLKGAEIIFCPSWTLSEYGFWRVRYGCQARCIENQIYMVHCGLLGNLGFLNLKGWGRASILTPCHKPWTSNGVLKEGRTNFETVVTAQVDIDELYINREKGDATPHKDRIRRRRLYRQLYNP